MSFGQRDPGKEDLDLKKIDQKDLSEEDKLLRLALKGLPPKVQSETNYPL